MTLYALCLGFLLGCPFWAALWFAVLRRRPRWPRFDHDMRGLVPLSGASERFFRRDYSDTKEIG